MFPKALALLSVLALAVAVQAQGDAPQVISFGDDVAKAAEVGSTNLMKRACVYDGCRCTPSAKGGLACGGSNVYQCAPNGDCCNYGFRHSCNNCGKLQCP
ncbi:hypothetical protein BGZ93_000800 [Podila epicladia]|nr:hypothetical protein BGZ92_002206 [Podila epicladia]KAG0085205.1 hypothetical protein BGZ93_000800 [Podila epicladia]